MWQIRVFVFPLMPEQTELRPKPQQDALH